MQLIQIGVDKTRKVGSSCILITENRMLFVDREIGNRDSLLHIKILHNNRTVMKHTYECSYRLSVCLTSNGNMTRKAIETAETGLNQTV